MILYLLRMHSGEANFVLHRSMGPGLEVHYGGLTAGSVGRSIYSIQLMLILLTRSNEWYLHVITARKLGNSQVF